MSWSVEATRSAGPVHRAVANAPFEAEPSTDRWFEAGLRVGAITDSSALQQALVDEATSLAKADRALLVLQAPATSPTNGLHIAAGRLPAGESAAGLLRAITPWLEAARADRITCLRHGPQGAAEVDQRSCLVAPLIANGELLGYLYCDVEGGSGRLGDTDRDGLALFARQAALALAHARRTEELERQAAASAFEARGALEQQTATAEILRIISGSITDTQPVFEAIVQSCQRLFDGKAVALTMPKETMIEAVAFASDGQAPASGGFLEPWPLDRGSGAGTCILESRLVAVADTVQAETRFPRMPQLALALGYHSALFVPLLREGSAIGSLAILRAASGEFTEKEIALAQTFASQAVIAIENARLFNETREALEQQKASAEILSVISGSVADAQPVFDKILESCKHLFGGDELDVLLVDEQGLLQVAAYVGKARDAVAATFPAPVDITPAGRAIRERRVAHYPDVLNHPDTPPVLRRMGRIVGYHSVAFAPMVWEDRGIGAVGVARSRGRLQRQGTGAAADLRRPGRDRDPERAAVPRDAGGAAAPDRHRRHPERDEQLADRCAARVRRHREEPAAAVRHRVRRRPAAARRHRLDARGRRQAGLRAARRTLSAPARRQHHRRPGHADARRPASSGRWRTPTRRPEPGASRTTSDSTRCCSHR